jgi:hypothetical protein
MIFDAQIMPPDLKQTQLGGAAKGMAGKTAR